MDEKIILTDCDGVLLNWEYAFHQWMEYRGHQRTSEDVGHLYKMTSVYPNVKNISDQVRAFNESAAIGFLPPFRDAQYYVKMLHEKHNYRFVCVTSMTTDPHANKLRERNLAKLFGDNTFKEVICLDCGADKDDVLEELSLEYPGAVWIEDKPDNAIAGYRFGFDCILMAHRHNKQFHHPTDFEYKRLLNWEEIYNYLLD